MLEGTVGSVDLVILSGAFPSFCIEWSDSCLQKLVWSGTQAWGPRTPVAEQLWRMLGPAVQLFAHQPW